MGTRTVLISGGSIAGPALALWLHRAGIKSIIVERAPKMRPGGQSVDIRGVARQVVQQMGIEPAVRKAWTGEEGLLFVDDTGKTRARLAADALGGEGLVAELEILRGDLARILYDATRGDCTYLFDNQITQLVDRGDGLDVRLAGGQTMKVDVVVGADGMNSRTRRLVFGAGARPRRLGLCMSYFTVPRTASDGRWARWYNAPGGRALLLRPDHVGTTRAVLSFVAAPQDLAPMAPPMTGAQQRARLREVFADAGWEVLRVLAALDATEDFYYESIGQVHLPSWSRGRAVLVGDAAYCASPISGMGTSLALVGAYILAGELARCDNTHDAFMHYERLMRPYVKQAQKLPPGAPRFAHPLTTYGVSAMHAFMRVVTAPGMRQILRRLMVPPASAIALPSYATHDLARRGAA